jgi:hypothetical protein
MGGKLGQHAVVVGASIAGLLAARVLSAHFDGVTALEQDVLEDRPAITSRSRKAIIFMGCCRVA